MKWFIARVDPGELLQNGTFEIRFAMLVLILNIGKNISYFDQASPTPIHPLPTFKYLLQLKFRTMKYKTSVVFNEINDVTKYTYIYSLWTLSHFVSRA